MTTINPRGSRALAQRVYQIARNYSTEFLSLEDKRTLGEAARFIEQSLNTPSAHSCVQIIASTPIYMGVAGEPNSERNIRDFIRDASDRILKELGETATEAKAARTSSARETKHGVTDSHVHREANRVSDDSERPCIAAEREQLPARIATETTEPDAAQSQSPKAIRAEALEEIKQHVGFIKSYALAMTSGNWIDLRDRIVRQSEVLATAVRYLGDRG